jgi:hypothetical protein
MNTLQELQNFALYILLFSLQVYGPIIMTTLAAPRTNHKKNWLNDDTADLVDHVFENRFKISQGCYSYEEVAGYLTGKYPDRPRSNDAVTSKLNKVRTFMSRAIWDLQGLS